MAGTYLSELVPAQAKLRQVLMDGAPATDFRNRLELGRRLFATTIDIAPAETHTVTYIYEVPDVLTSDGYRLLIQNQATPWPDEFSVDVSVPASAVIGLREGFGRGASLDWSGPLVAEKELRAEVEVPWYARWLANISSLLRRPAVKVERLTGAARPLRFAGGPRCSLSQTPRNPARKSHDPPDSPHI